jgi:tetratricopeptide (TPR) repeat protein
MEKIKIVKFIRYTALLSTFITLGFLSELNGQVLVKEDTLVIPTYMVNPPSALPRFYDGSSHQGVQRHVYPYPYNDNLTRIKEDRKYKIIYLENEFIKIGVMPGMGGRIFEAIDKTNGYNFIYRQHVIKPALIGMLGYWISGGLAWGFPNHHGATTVEPMDYSIEKKTDGSVTIWMAVTELLHRMRILIGYTIQPNSSIVEMTIRPNNPTPYVNSFLFWANPAVHANTDYQVIFPPSVEYITGHHKVEMNSWPIADRRYFNFDYQGRDISLWKNTGVPTSFFSWDPQEDFFGGYDHGKQAGTAWIGNHYLSPGMKYWTDGNNPAGEMINNGLTDNDGRYIELMASAYSDNQPDYSWIQPDEAKDVTMYWYPIRILGGMKAANTNAALNLTADDKGNILVRLNTTHIYKNAKVLLTYNGQEKLKEIIDINPAGPYSNNIKFTIPINMELLKLTLYDSSNEVVLEYQPQARPGKPMPKPLEPPAKPEDVKTIEELYLIGLRINQFFNASTDPYPYYFEALKRDPSDYRVNTQLGILYSKRKMWKEAEKHLLTAVDRITMMYTRPKDSEALYYLGLVQRELNKKKEAYDKFYDASWNVGWYTQSYHQLAEMDCEAGDFEKALEHINRALSTDVNNQKTRGLKVVVLRKLGRLEEAKGLAESIIKNDQLDYQSRNELFWIERQLKQFDQAQIILSELVRIMQDKVESYLEFATFYSDCGFYEEAIDILSRLEMKSEQFPMLYYYLGYYWSKLNNEEKAQLYFSQAQKKPYTYCFPFRDEEVNILNKAIEYNPKDAMAYYYLGNLYYELQPERGIDLWEKSQSIDSSFYIVQRNLAWAALQNQKDLNKALFLYRKAFANNREDPRLIYEYAFVCQCAKVPPKDIYNQIFKNNRNITEKRSETFISELELLNNIGKFDEVIEVLTNHDFVESEGSTRYRDVYLNAYILKSISESRKGNYQNAITYMQKALDFPLGRAQQRKAQMNYILGTFYEKLGKSKIAKACFEKSSVELVEGTEFMFYKGLALQKIGQNEKAAEQFKALNTLSNKEEETDFYRSFEAGSKGNVYYAQKQYIKGLAYLGLNKTEEAKGEFERAIGSDPSHLWAQNFLNDLAIH